MGYAKYSERNALIPKTIIAQVISLTMRITRKRRRMMSNELIVKCGVCGHKILYQGEKYVVGKVMAAHLQVEGVEQNGALWWHGDTVVPTKVSENDCNAFLEEELVHKITAYQEMSVIYYTCGSGYVYLPILDKKFRFDNNPTTIMDALGEALYYLSTL